MTDTSTIIEGEYHPSADLAMTWYKNWVVENPTRYMMTLEGCASAALSGNRLAEICYGTLTRLRNGDPVSDRYLLGLVWMLRNMEKKTDENTR